jgi:tripartite-type tricarboxylate transporter receptor subunit TctC
MKRPLGELVLLYLITLSMLAGEAVQAQTYPTKPITVVLSSIGGNTDLTLRAVSSVAEKYLGQPLIIQHKVGGGGTIAADLVARSEPDGYTLFGGTIGSICTIPAVTGRSKGPNDLVAICRVSAPPAILSTRLDRPWKDLKGMIAWAKANPNQLKVGAQGAWSPGDAAWRAFVKETGVTSRVVMYDGGGQTLLAVLGGHVDIAPGMITHSGAQIKAGKIGCLANFDDMRSPELGDVPTAKEQGVNVVFHNWVAMVAPKGTPRPIIDKLAMAFKQMTEDPLAIDMMKKIGESFRFTGGDEFTKIWRAEYEFYKELGKTSKTN